MMYFIIIYFEIDSSSLGEGVPAEMPESDDSQLSRYKIKRGCSQPQASSTPCHAEMKTTSFLR